MRRAARRQKFEAVSLSESLRLAMIVGSSAFIALAGNFAQSSAEAPVVTQTATLKSEFRSEVKATQAQLESFADGEIMQFEERLAALVERAEMKDLASSPGYRQELALHLNKLHDKIDASRESLLRLSENKLKKTSKAKAERKFLEEDLRADIFALQDAWETNGLRIVALLEDPGLIYVRNVSVTGQ